MAKVITLRTRLRSVSLWIMGPITCWLLVSGAVTILFLLIYFLRELVLLISRLPDVSRGDWVNALIVLLLTLGIIGVLLLVLWYPGSVTRDALFTPGTITFEDDQTVSFRFVLSTRRIPAADIVSVRKVPYRRLTSWYSQSWWIYIDYQRGKKITHIRFDANMLEDLFALWGELKDLNPRIIYDLGEKTKLEP